MDYEGYRYMFLGAAAVSIFLFLISLFLFIKFRIPKIIGELSGFTAKKKIKKMTYEAKPINIKSIYNFDDDNRTEVLKSENLKGDNFSDENKTEVLKSNDESEAKTELLQDYGSETEVLSKNTDQAVQVVEDITFIHAGE